MNFYLPPHVNSPVSFNVSSVNSVTSSALFAQTESNSYNYGEGVYNGDVYNGSLSTSSPGGLVNTGTVVAFTVTVAAILIFGALLTRFWKRPKKDSSKIKKTK